jgi:hypothetical protein
MKVRGIDVMDISTSHATIGTAINERAERHRGCMSGKIILDSMGIDFAIKMAVNVNTTVLDMLGTGSNSRRDGLVGGQDL